MSSYHLPDITGTNPDYLKVNIPYNVYQAGMKIIFENSPVFTNSIQLKMTNGSRDVLIRGTDWVVNPDDIDHAGMSRAFLADPQFTGQLVKSVTIFSAKALGSIIVANFQQFYLTTPGAVFDDGTPLEFTPDLAKSLISGLADARQQVARVYSPVASADYAPKLLPFDINKELPGNVITDEEILVNTVIGTKILRLTQGAYFATGLSLTYNNVPLDKDTQFVPFVVSPLTKESIDRGGIYQYILLVGDYVGSVKVTYHAVGGDVQPSDVAAMYEYMTAIKTYLSEEVFVTADTISETAAFRAFHARLTQQESLMRSLASGAPTYGDSTAGESVIRPISASDANFHWYNIASLYKTQGSTDIFLADQFKGRVFFPGANVSLSFTADVNLNQTRQTVSFKTDSLVFDPTYTLFTDISVNAPVYPMARLIWNQSGQTFSGAILQIGIPLTALTDKLIVEDLSSSESCWLLDKTNQFITGGPAVSPATPKDSGVTLPDGVSLWSSTGPNSKSRTLVPSFEDGYLVYAGAAVTLTQLAVTTSTTGFFPVALPKYFPVRHSRTLIVTMASTDGNKTYDVTIPLQQFANGSKKSTASFVNSVNEQVALAVDIHQDDLQVITLALNVTRLSAAASSGSMSDVVRYVRVKV